MTKLYEAEWIGRKVVLGARSVGARRSALGARRSALGGRSVERSGERGCGPVARVGS